MTKLKLTFERIQQYINSDSDFPIPFDEIWESIGYTRKDNAKRALISSGLIENVDWVFLICEENSMQQGSQGGRPSENIFLTVDGFKQFAMMTGTKEGRDVRLYFIDCEKQLRQQEKEKLDNLKYYQNELEAVKLSKTIPEDLNRLETLSKPLAEVLKQTILGDIPRVINQTFTSSDQMQRDLNASLVANRLGLTLNKHLKTLEMIKNIYSPESYNQLKQMYEELATDYNKLIEKVAVQGVGVSSEVLQDLKDRVAKGEANLEKLGVWQREIEVLARELEADNLDLQIEVQRQCRLNRTLLDENKALTQANLDLLERLNRLEHLETTNNSKGGLKRLKPSR